MKLDPTNQIMIFIKRIGKYFKEINKTYFGIPADKAWNPLRCPRVLVVVVIAVVWFFYSTYDL